MPAHEHLQNQLFTGQGSVAAQRRKRLLAKSQQVMEDIDFVVDNKPYPKNEALEASDLKRWGPDPDPVDPANPTIFRFDTGIDPHINNRYYRTAEQEGTYSEYLLANNDRNDRIDMFGNTSPDQQVYLEHHGNKGQDGPLHGLAQPIYENESDWDRSKKRILYMSKEEKADLRKKALVNTRMKGWSD
jgi:hypothetical protein